jgi:hypothetical protein
MGGTVGLETVLGILIGIGLSAACGFRVFIPLLVMGVAARLGWFDPSPGFTWLASTPALAAFAAATAIEVAAAHVPWLDHVLDVVAAPLAVAAGALTMAGALGEASPLLRWSLALIAGGGTAGIFHGLNGMLRLGSTATTAGLGNPVFATIETAGSFVLAAVAVLVPLAGIAVGILVAVLILRRRRRAVAIS